MKRLSKHILSLLRLYDNVALPGIGVFSLEYFPANIDRDNSIILPPRFGVVFNALKGNSPIGAEEFAELEILSEDNRLLDSYIRKEQLDPEDAWKLLASDLSEFRTYLGYGGNPVLSEFNLLNPPYPSLRIHPLKTAQKSGDEEDVSKEELDLKKRDYKRFKHPDYYYIPVHKKLAKIAACFLLVVIVGLAAVIPFGNTANKPATASIVPITVNEEPGQASDNTDVAVEPTQSEPAIEAEDENDSIPGALSLETSPRIETKENHTAKYYAVVAAFKTEKEANKFIDSHKGDKSRFDIIKNSKYYLISASSSSQKEELESNLPLIRAHYPDAWIFSMK